MDRERYIRRYETILAYYEDIKLRRSHKGPLFNSELESFVFMMRQYSYFSRKHRLYGDNQLEKIDDFITSMTETETEPHRDTAHTLYDNCAHIYNLYVAPVINSKVSLKYKDDFEAIHRSFKRLSDTYKEDYVQSRDRGLRFRCKDQEQLLLRKNKIIFVELTAYLFFSVFVADDFQKISLIVKSIFQHLDNLLVPKNDITLNDIFVRFSHLPMPVYQGFCYHLYQNGVMDEALYYKFLFSIKSDDIDSFSKILSENNIFLIFRKYYELIALADILYSTLNERKFDPDKYIEIIRDFFDKLTPHSATKGKDTRGLCIPVVGIINSMKYDNVLLHEIYPKIIDKSELCLLYNRYCQIHLPLSSNSSDSMLHAFQKEVDNLNSSPIDTVANHQDTISYENELNCKFPDRIDDFINYLAWREYIKEGDQSSFKYDVFGGCKPTDYSTISFDFRKKSASTMLGIIIWQLRKEKNDPEYLYNKKITQSNSHIGVGDESMRIFVDFCLFFPSLISSLVVKETNKNEINALIKERLKERVRELNDCNDYNNCSSILEFIQKREAEDLKYWVVSKKK